jgi:hypothetical protein
MHFPCVCVDDITKINKVEYLFLRRPQLPFCLWEMHLIVLIARWYMSVIPAWETEAWGSWVPDQPELFTNTLFQKKKKSLDTVAHS